MILHPRGRSGCERRHSADLGFVALLFARWAARNREALTAPGLLRSEEEQMGALQGYLREQSIKTDVHALPVAPGAALAIVLTAFALGSVVTGGKAPADEPATLSLIGP